MTLTVLHSSSRCTESKAYIDLEFCLPLIDLFYDVTEDEYLIYCALVLSKSSLFFSKNMVYTVLYSLDDDCSHYFAGHRQNITPRQFLHSFKSPCFGIFTIKPFFHWSGTFSLCHIVLNSLVNSFTAKSLSALYSSSGKLSIPGVLPLFVFFHSLSSSVPSH